MRKNTLPAFHRCQQSAIMTSILYDLDSKKQIRYIADLLFHLCNISLSKLYTDLCNSVAATLDQLPVVGDHENGSAAPESPVSTTHSPLFTEREMSCTPLSEFSY